MPLLWKNLRKNVIVLKRYSSCGATRATSVLRLVATAELLTAQWRTVCACAWSHKPRVGHREKRRVAQRDSSVDRQRRPPPPVGDSAVGGVRFATRCVQSTSQSSPLGSVDCRWSIALAAQVHVAPRPFLHSSVSLTFSVFFQLFLVRLNPSRDFFRCPTTFSSFCADRDRRPTRRNIF